KMKHDTLAAGLLLFVMASSGCKKIIDEIIKKPNGIATDCRIEKITTNAYGLTPDHQEIIVPDTAYISYNAAGNPTRIRHTVNSNPLLAQDPYYKVPPVGSIFKYDAQNRLIAYLEGYERDTVYKLDKTYTWRVFKYTGFNKVTAITYNIGTASYGAGDDYNSIKNEPDSHEGIWDANSGVYTLDAFGRITKRKWLDGSHQQTYSYDASGNKVGGNYTDKINYRQTNKVWMFLNNDYSVNMKSPPYDYYINDDSPNAFNSKKMPTGFDWFPRIVPSYYYFIGDYATNGPIVMHYECK
ncbi:MAG TPA: hypothetical protein VFV68_17495, partial [Agriterribacter sp.]|nr:hypothetical protein [Agriterribacter sp.]